ncbi:glycosyltransferase family 2 protein [Saccharomonospora xinjiangensis]|uniref:Glycosyl transferase n=1 Tax=Saccharomonospora xinjiangensis XJ-54 TaxID=882086 RepID=I0V0X2_9PSEU|nr:glycosyltransferase family 2 protein [Saccharomonospora xinjiangensis]EID53775.1 glycosyl transferase [Saccharomonospora xinjiangensis XJ-54]
MRLSVIVPCYNEETCLPRLRAALLHVLPPLTDEFEIILIDDGSTDGTLEMLRAMSRSDPRFRYLSLSRNFGKEAAMLAGLRHAAGDLVAILDADLQHPPELLGDMVALIDKGYDQVVAKRTRTGDGHVRTAASRAYYRMMNRLVDVELTDGVGDFRLLSRRAVDALLSLEERNRFSKGLFSWIGFDTAVVDYENVARTDGASKWSLRSLLNYGIDGILSFNHQPLRLAVYLGALCTAAAFGYAMWLVISALLHGTTAPGYVTIMCGIIGFGGMQLLLVGVLGEYLGRIYHETKHRPHFLLKETSHPAGPEAPCVDD